jgi:oxygen-dependent protoporphyrinogen oxidase
MAALPEKLAEELRGMIRYEAPVTSIGPRRRDNSTSGWQVSVPGGEQIEAEHLVLAIPAHVASRLLEISAPQLASRLKAIEHAPISTVSLAYERSKVSNSLDGFGFMAPRSEGLNMICTFWNSSLFQGRAPEGTVVITSFAGRARKGTGGALADEACAQTVEAENARILGITGRPLERMVWKDPQALPQYNVGHRQRVAEMYNILHSLPNLHLIGNFLTGRSIGDCVDVASRVAENLHSQLERQSI